MVEQADSQKQQQRSAVPKPVLRRWWQGLKRSQRALIILTGVITGLFALYVCWLFAGPGPESTGDELFDRYASAVNKRIASGKFLLQGYWSSSQYFNHEFAASVPDKVLASWEDEFGDDPRYWELRYFCADAASGVRPLPKGIKQPSDFLKLGIERGATSSNLLLLYYERERHNLENELNLLPYYSKLEDYSPAERQQCIKEHVRVEAEQLALIDDAVSADPTQAWGYYWRAMYWFRLGEQEQGLADLAAGNAAKNGDYPIPFPLSRVLAEARQGEALGGKVISGAVMEASIVWALPNFIEIKEHCKETLLACELGSDPALALNPWRGFACRMGTDAPTLIHGLVGLVLIDIQDAYYLELHPELITDSQEHALRQSRAARIAGKEYVKALNDQADALDEQAKYFTMISPLYGRYKWSYKYISFELERVEAVATVIADLKQLDYATLELPEALADYRLSAEQQERDRKQEEDRLAQELATHTPIVPLPEPIDKSVPPKPRQASALTGQK